MMMKLLPAFLLAALPLLANAYKLPFEDPTPGIKDDAELTYFEPGKGDLNKPGACGKQNTVDDPIVAVAHGYFDAVAIATGTFDNPNKNPLCFMKIEITTEFGKTIATITDRCHDCDRPHSIDVTPKLAPPLFGGENFKEIGRIKSGVTWRFVDPDTEEPLDDDEYLIDMEDDGDLYDMEDAEYLDTRAGVSESPATRTDVTSVKRRRLRFV